MTLENEVILLEPNNVDNTTANVDNTTANVDNTTANVDNATANISIKGVQKWLQVLLQPPSAINSGVVYPPRVVWLTSIVTQKVISKQDPHLILTRPIQLNLPNSA